MRNVNNDFPNELNKKWHWSKPPNVLKCSPFKPWCGEMNEDPDSNENDEVKNCDDDPEVS